MENINFLTEILTSDFKYWIVAKKREVREYMKFKRVDDDIMYIAIPYDIKCNQKREEIKLTDLERLKDGNIPNIFLSNNNAPFQIGISMYEVYKGYPIKSNHKQILKDCLQLESNNIHDYKAILDRYDSK